MKRKLVLIGAVKNMPNDAILEMLACATADGFKPLVIDDFPICKAAIFTINLK